MAIDKPFAWPVPRSAYIHVPFCRHRCGYCNFSVVADRDDLVDRYLAALDRELSALSSPTIDTLFIGGGTPTHFNRNDLLRLFRIVTERFQLADRYEWTIEANPEDMNEQTIETIAQAGVNRVSLGIQSFHDAKLSVLERGHSAEQSVEVVRRVASSIKNVSIDLIFGAPNETVSQWKTDVTTALALPIQHLSTYALTYEKGTTFWNRRLHGELTPANEPDEAEMYERVREITSEHGMNHYEISNFAKPGHECRHNIAYWQGRGWYAAGPGATRFVDGKRTGNHRSTTTYLKRVESGTDPIAESETLTAEQYARERAAFGVRMLSGVNLADLADETGVELRDCYVDAIADLRSQGLIEFDDRLMRLTPRGVMFADMVARELL